MARPNEVSSLSETHPQLANEAHGWDPSAYSAGSIEGLLDDSALMIDNSPNRICPFPESGSTSDSVPLLQLIGQQINI